MISQNISPVYVNRAYQNWTANGGVYGDGGVHYQSSGTAPTLDLQFAGATAISSQVTFTRASTGTYYNSAGVLSSAAVNEARLDYNPSTLAAQGLLIEEARTNSIRNNTMVGAVAGTPGTICTNWNATPTNRTIVGTGTENGINYIDIQYVSGGAANADVQFEGAVTSAANGQNWTASQYVRLIGGTLTNIVVTQILAEYSITPTFLAATTTNIVPTSAALNTQRFSQSRTNNNASTAFEVSTLRFAASGASDVTLRIGLPQLELGSFATSVIPTTTTALTRAADVASVNTLTPWYNAVEGTLFAEFAGRQAGVQPYLTMLSNTGETERIYQRYLSSQYQTIARVAGVDIAAVYNSSEGSAVNAKIASAYNSSQLATSTNGQAVTGSAVASLSSVPSGLNKLWLGSFAGISSFANGHLRRITYYPQKLQAITA